MPIVINSFEAVAEAPGQQKPIQERGENGNGDKLSADDLEPRDLAVVLHSIAEQSLRSWAH